MAKLLLPKRLHPDFRSPGVRPVGPVVLDLDNPLARKTRIVLLPSVMGAVNLRDGKIQAISGDVRQTPEGWLFGGSVGDIVTLDTDVTDGDNPFSVFMITTLDQVGSGANPIFIGRGDTAANEWMLRETATNLQFFGDGGTATATGDNLPADAKHILGLSILDSPTVSYDALVYQNGLLTGSDFTGANSKTTTKALILGGTIDAEAARVFKGTMEYILVFDGALTAEEHLSLAQDPYQVLKPAVPRLQQLPAAGTEVDATLATLTLAGFDATVQADVDLNVSATLATLTLAALDTTVQADVDLNVSATLATLTLAAFDSTVQSDVDLAVSATLATLTLAGFDTTVQAGAGLDVSATLATLTLAALDVVVQADVDLSVSATLATLTLAAFDAVVQADVDLDVSATLATLTLADLDAVVQANVDTDVNATLATLTLTGFDTTIQADVDTNVSATLATLSLVPFDTSVISTRAIQATLATLTLAGLATTLRINRNINATLATMSLASLDATVVDVGAGATGFYRTVSGNDLGASTPGSGFFEADGGDDDANTGGGGFFR